jgi:L-lactate utilization protein LutC
MSSWDKLADKATVEKTMAALKANGIEAFFIQTGEEAKEKALDLIPQGAGVFDMTSMTLETISVAKEILESGKWESVRNKLNAMDRKTQRGRMQEIGAAPEWAIGSVHAVTEEGQVMIASRSGSQLPAYAYGANHVIWVVGTHKIVKDIDEGFKRIYEHSLPLEDARARKAYGIGSSVNKILIINQEAMPERITLIFVNEVLGF